MSRVIDCDVVIIGGGPAGSTAARLLSESGRDVVVLERDQFPRYHVGESLMPYCYFTLEKLGVIAKIKQSSYPEKHSVQFVGRRGKISTPFYFFQHLKHDAARTWQVVRSEFDKMLLDHAADAGAKVFEQTAAKQLLHDDSGKVIGVQAIDDNNEPLQVNATVTIDASGRDGFVISRENWRLRDPALSKISVWTYFKKAVRDPGLDAGATTIAYLPEKGWFWYIPLPDDVVGVGLVADRDYIYRDNLKEPAEVFTREIKNNQWITDHLAPAKQFGQYWVTGDYSYRSRYCAADGLVLVGDAMAFLDPVFSSGVFLALKSGELAASVIDESLTLGDVSAARFTQYSQTMCKGIEAMRKLVYAFYDSSFSFGDLIRNHPDVRPDLTDCLIGHLFRDFDALFEAVGQFAKMPKPLEYGTPLIGEKC